MSDEYTELEWSVGLQAPAADDDIYEFRVYAGTTPLDTYALTPQLTAAVTAPGAPTGVTGTPGDTQVSLTWTAPASNGGSAITDYIVQWALSSAPTSWTTFSEATSTATTATVTGLTNGTAYVFHVAAVNAIGTGSYSSTSAAVTPSGGGGLAWKWDFTGMANQAQPSEFTTWGGSVPGEIVGGLYKSTVDWYLNQLYRNSTGTPAYPTTTGQIISVEYQILTLTPEKKLRIFYQGASDFSTWAEVSLSTTGGLVIGSNSGGDILSYTPGLTVGIHRCDIVFDPGASPVLKVYVDSTQIYSGGGYPKTGFVPGLGVGENTHWGIRKWYFGNLADGMPA